MLDPVYGESYVLSDVLYLVRWIRCVDLVCYLYGTNLSTSYLCAIYLWIHRTQSVALDPATIHLNLNRPPANPNPRPYYTY